MRNQIYIVPTTIDKTFTYQAVLELAEKFTNESLLARHFNIAVKLEAALHTNFSVDYSTIYHINLQDKFIWHDPEIESMLLRITANREFYSVLDINCYQTSYNDYVKDIVEDNLKDILTPSGVEKALDSNIYWGFSYFSEESPLFKYCL